MSGMKITAPDGICYGLDELLTVTNVMEIFEVTNITVYNWLGKIDDKGVYSEGKFEHAFKLGKIYIPMIDVQKYISNKYDKL